MRDRAVDLPIQRTIDFIFYLSNSVTHAQGLMCKKFRSIMKSKQHLRGVLRQVGKLSGKQASKKASKEAGK